MATHSSILAWRIPIDRGAWRATAHRVTKSQIQLNDEACHVHIYIYICVYRYINMHIHTHVHYVHKLLTILKYTASYTESLFHSSLDFSPFSVYTPKMFLLPGLPWWFSGWDSVSPMQGNWVQFLAWELDSTCCNYRSHMPQPWLKILCAITKTQCRQRNKLINTWNNRLVPNHERSTSRLYIVTLLI